MAAPTTDSAAGAAKLKAVTELVDKLTQDLKEISLLPAERNAALEELKIYGRDPENADPIFTKDGISTLLRHSFHSPSSDTARAAMRVLANAMLLKPSTRQMFVDMGFANKASKELSSDTWDDEFLLSRILFLSTYETNVDLPALIEKQGLADHMVENLARHVKVLSSKSKAAVEPMEELALVETLKLLFTVTYHCKEKVAWFTPAAAHIAALLWKHDVPKVRPLGPPFGPLTNALLNLNFAADKSQAALFPKSDPTKVSAKLIELLDRSMATYNEEDYETLVTPLVSLVGRVHEHAPEPVQKSMRQSLLPTAEDRQSILGRGRTLSARLLKNSTSPVAPALRDAISHLLFDMSDKNASTFVQNVGYGFASGFLFQNNVPIPASASEAFSTSDTAGTEKPVNPITGQFVDKEKHPELPPMSQEEKEREAEKLFVLFERLKKTGIVDIQNPVEAAIQEGRFEELDDEVEKVG